MSWKDKLFGSRILAVGKHRYKKADGTAITVTKDIRYTVKDGRSTIHMPCFSVAPTGREKRHKIIV